MFDRPGAWEVLLVLLVLLIVFGQRLPRLMWYLGRWFF